MKYNDAKTYRSVLTLIFVLGIGMCITLIRQLEYLIVDPYFPFVVCILFASAGGAGALALNEEIRAFERKELLGKSKSAKFRLHRLILYSGPEQPCESWMNEKSRFIIPLHYEKVIENEAKI